ncbi:Uma2 family endonuclease [Leptothermofonsia sichuanensis E412]|nr:Uma2 family endonuclease [Leptothermofonsia sichuanensis]QZZ23579.1 Uma2 family endonuclease [Leptothermofonsia sichuanensis E412]
MQNVARIQGRTVDLSSDPPPDLVLEVDTTNPSTRKLPIYRELGVPEIWRYTRQGVQIFHLQAGNYQPCEFTMISGATLNQFLQQAEAQDDTTLIRSWRKWIRGVRSEKWGVRSEK